MEGDKENKRGASDDLNNNVSKRVKFSEGQSSRDRDQSSELKEDGAPDDQRQERSQEAQEEPTQPETGADNLQVQAESLGTSTNVTQQHGILVAKQAPSPAMVADARTYLKTVRNKLERNRPDMYQDFVKLLGQYHARSIDRAAVVERVRKLFRHYPDLLPGFSTFLPEGQEIVEKPSLEEGRKYFDKMRQKLRGNCNPFMSLVLEESVPIPDVYHKVASLLDNDGDSINEFKRYFPKSIIRDFRKMHKEKLKTEL